MNELLTCVRENIPVVAVVFNNGQWGEPNKAQELLYEGHIVGTEIKNPNFADVAETMGAQGIRVSKPENIGIALTSLLLKNKPGVLELMVSTDMARPRAAAVLPKPVRHLEKYKK